MALAAGRSLVRQPRARRRSQSPSIAAGTAVPPGLALCGPALVATFRRPHSSVPAPPACPPTENSEARQSPAYRETRRSRGGESAIALLLSE